MTTAATEAMDLNDPKDGVIGEDPPKAAVQLQDTTSERSWQEEQKSKLARIISTRRLSEQLETPEECVDRVRPSRRKGQRGDTRDCQLRKSRRPYSTKGHEHSRGGGHTGRTSTRSRSRTGSPTSKVSSRYNGGSSPNKNPSYRYRRSGSRSGGSDAKISHGQRAAHDTDTRCGGSSSRRNFQDVSRNGISGSSKRQNWPAKMNLKEGYDLDESLSIQESPRSGLPAAAGMGAKSEETAIPTTRFPGMAVIWLRVVHRRAQLGPALPVPANGKA
jgi:hypothetical protein